MSDADLYNDFKNSLAQLLHVVDDINGMDFDVYKNPRTKLLVSSLETVERNEVVHVVSVANEIMKSIYRWYDGGFKCHSEDEHERQYNAVSNTFEAAVRYLAKHGDEDQRQSADFHLKRLR